MTPCRRRRPNLFSWELLPMGFDWVPGAGIAVAGGFLGWWRNTVILGEHIEALALRHDEFRSSIDTRLLQQDTRIQEQAKDLRAADDYTKSKLDQALLELNHVTTLLKVSIAEQTAISQVNTKMLEGLLVRLEELQKLSHQHDTDIALIKQRAAMA